MNGMTETKMQAVLMTWAMGRHNHVYVLPNSTVIFPWESDLLTVTKALFIHEFEIKISLADYKKDSEKESKHNRLSTAFSFPGLREYTPNYFWYATFNFDIDPPEYAGWVKVIYNEKHFYYDVHVQKEAPLLSRCKVTEKTILDITRLLSWRMTNIYHRYEQIEIGNDPIEKIGEMI